MYRISALAAAALMASSVAVAQDSTTPPALMMVRAFSQVCGQTNGDPAAVAAAAQGAGWTRGGARDGVTIWHMTAGDARLSLLTGQQSGEGKTRWICSIMMSPPVPVPDAMMTAEMGPTLATIDASKGIYVMAASAQAVEAGDIAFVTASTDATGATLLYMRAPVR